MFLFKAYGSVSCLIGLSYSKTTKKFSHIFPCITFVVILNYFLKLEMCSTLSVGKSAPT